MRWNLGFLGFTPARKFLSLQRFDRFIVFRRTSTQQLGQRACRMLLNAPATRRIMESRTLKR